MLPFIAVAAGLFAAGTVASVVEQRKSRKAQKKANEVTRKIEERQAAKERAAAIRQASIARATAQASAVNTGTVDSSGYMGQTSAIQATTAGNIAFGNQLNTGSQQVFGYRQQAADAESRASNYQAIANLSLQAASFYSSMPSSTAPKAPTKR